MFLWHFPSPRDAPPLAGTLPCGVRTFLPAANRGERPPGPLASQYSRRRRHRADRPAVATSTISPPQHDVNGVIGDGDTSDRLPQRGAEVGKREAVPLLEHPAQ